MPHDIRNVQVRLQYILLENSLQYGVQNSPIKPLAVSVPSGVRRTRYFELGITIEIRSDFRPNMQAGQAAGGPGNAEACYAL
jgi:hypothetical protein